MIDRLPHDTTKTFSEIFESKDVFILEWKDSGIYSEGILKEKNISLLYFLLYAKYGNSAIVNWDIEQWKYKLWSIIFQFGPTWQRRLEIQETLRNLKEEEILIGSKAIYNHAFNPEGEPSTSSLDEVTYINDQSTTNHKKSKLEGYAILLDLLESDVTGEFIAKFKNLFATFVYTKPDLFVTEE